MRLLEPSFYCTRYSQMEQIEIKHLDQLSIQFGSTLFLVYIFQIIWLAGSHSDLSNRGSRIIAFLGFTGCWKVVF
ncbi:hypothetical protein V6N12_042222 [Hibiscus sabdariffa]|uniref:Uncharacterized protein n=1 Tax=Hibiscus sabdariffa TaxID=183260 RepID=A0ABR2EE55_9ROSI